MSESIRDSSAAPAVELCCVYVGGEVLGMPIRHIIEILGAVQPLTVPLAPAFVGGLAHYRGEVLMTVSLRRLLDMPPAEGPQDMLVLESPNDCFGLLVDAAGEVLSASALDFEKAPSTLSEGTAGLFAGTCMLPNRLLALLNPEHLDPMRLSERLALQVNPR
jgi:purine-binding chemotaxis protein CheW